MRDPFEFDDEFYPVPASAIDADPAEAMRELLYRVSRLEQELEETQVQALADTKALFMELLSLSDDIAAIVDRWGVTTKATEAVIIRSVVALGRKLRQVLDYHGIASVHVVGKPLDPETSDVVATEEREHVPHRIVLRERRVGYTWPYGVLRRAEVVVSTGAKGLEAVNEKGLAENSIDDTERVEDDEETAE
jgi:molecular chaperone GrpE (heat shock protein)